MDFITDAQCDVVVVINSCVVFLCPSTVSSAIRLITDDEYDTVVSASPICTHVVSNDMPFDFRADQKLPRTQALPKLRALNFGVSVWRCGTFPETDMNCGVATFSGRYGVVETGDMEGLDIDAEFDFQLADALTGTALPLPPPLPPDTRNKCQNSV